MNIMERTKKGNATLVLSINCIHHKFINFISLFKICTKFVISWVHIFCTQMLCNQNIYDTCINKMKNFQYIYVVHEVNLQNEKKQV